jgi:DNA-binding transcriptional ArsR family regulator
MPAAASCDVFTAIADPTRRAIIELLAQAERSVGEITARFPMSMSAISQHLAVLRSAGLVQMRSLGRSRRYRLHAESLRVVSAWVDQHTAFWDARLEALRQHVEDQP